MEQVSWIRHMRLGRERKAGSWIGQLASSPEGRLELTLGPGTNDLRFESPSRRPDGLPDERWAWMRLLLPRFLSLDVEPGEPHEQDVVFQLGGAVRIRNPSGVEFGSSFRTKDGEDPPKFPRVRNEGNHAREHFPLPPGDWQLVYWMDGKQYPVDVHVAPGVVTEVVLDPEALRRASAEC